MKSNLKVTLSGIQTCGSVLRLCYWALANFFENFEFSLVGRVAL